MGENVSLVIRSGQMLPGTQSRKEIITMTAKKALALPKPRTLNEKAKQLLELELMQRDIREAIADRKADLLAYMQKNKTLGLKTEDYTLTRAKRITPQVVDFDQLKETLEKNDIPYETQVVFADQMKVVFKQAIDEGRDLPGLEGLETEYVMVRVKEVKK